ncbi:hypothetical protein K466DRAFT_397808 [Polyporus arcularius HHB13444]|uniref:Uncharacterized protein n=2 Tax=Polyporaceae TaxID=5317 RepID=A0A5C3PWN3_9APHY|nr:hypothetical protein OH76DRAFT_1153806 [Polyporus brumalis]TFK94254.1 hypothetical protein K466DRAFT_397808 [Polyporus arcularius HHB13444]
MRHGQRRRRCCGWFLHCASRSCITADDITLSLGPQLGPNFSNYCDSLHRRESKHSCAALTARGMVRSSSLTGNTKYHRVQSGPDEQSVFAHLWAA